jgi:glycosyltransferase involved in cell wall biosynthesis
MYPDLYRRSETLRMKALVPWSCRRADLIFTVSEYARQQIHDCYGIPLEKIVVTFNAADHMAEARNGSYGSHEFDLRKPYLLYCGLIQPRKNIVRLVEAFDLFKRRTGLPHELVLAGKMGWHSEELQRRLASLQCRDSIRLLGYIGNPSLAPVMAGAELFVFPSIFESFGIPVLESQIIGVPALVAQGSCFPEIFGDSTYYCDPLSIESIATAMETLIKDAPLRAELSRRGVQRAQKYTWKNSARIALQAYRSLIEEAPNMVAVTAVQVKS